MTAQEKTARVLVSPTAAHKDRDCTSELTAQALRRLAFIATRGALCVAALRVRGYEVTQNDDGSFDAVHQYRTEHLPNFPALEGFARSLGAKLLSDGGAP